LAAECELEIESGIPCGVQAVGRCSNCRKAFCLTHQAADLAGPVQTTYRDQCTLCLYLARKPQIEAATRKARLQLFVLGGDRAKAQRLLRSANVPMIEVVEFTSSSRKKRFGGWETTTTRNTIADGWLIGNARWRYNDGSNYGGRDLDVEHLTALLNLETGSLATDALVRVVPLEDGTYSKGPGHKGYVAAHDLDHVNELIHRLAGTLEE
jgi:hypothetical protein